jgi:hypothetical protein
MKRLAPHLGHPVDQASFHVGNVFSQMLVGALVLTSTAVFRRERIAKVGLFDASMRIGEDYDFLLRTAREGDVGYIDAPSMQYQRGLTDHLSRDENKLEHALSHLKTIEPFLKRDRSRIHLSDERLREVLSGVHRWIGERAFLRGDRPLAREHFGKSLRLEWRQRRCLGMFLMTCAPAWLDETLSKTYRMCKNALRHRPREQLSS